MPQGLREGLHARLGKGLAWTSSELQVPMPYRLIRSPKCLFDNHYCAVFFWIELQWQMAFTVCIYSINRGLNIEPLDTERLSMRALTKIAWSVALTAMLLAGLLASAQQDDVPAGHSQAASSISFN